MPEIEMKERDVYRWAYKEPGNDADWGRYHCCSRIGFFLDGALRDTYWMYGEQYRGGSGRSFLPEAFPRLELTFIANLDDLEPAEEYQADYYDDSDIVNLNHPNATSGYFYIRKGAKRSQAKMLEVANRKLLTAQSDQQFAFRKAEELHEKVSRIRSGDFAGVYL